MDNNIINNSPDAQINQFIKGFVFGQALLILLIFFLVKLFLLRNADETKADLRRTALRSPSSRPPAKTKNALPLRQHAFESHVLSKTLYSVHAHPPESCDWINVLLAQIVARYRSDATVAANIVKYIDARINKNLAPNGSNSRPSFLGQTTITEFALGEEYVNFKGARMRYAEDSSNLRAEIDFEYNDQITIGIDTAVILNWPKPAIASLPISLVLSVVKFSGTLAIEFVTHPDSSETFFAVSILQGFALEFDVRSLLGHRTKVKDLPKLTELITSQLRGLFEAEIVWPSFRKVHIPIWFSDASAAAGESAGGREADDIGPGVRAEAASSSAHMLSTGKSEN